MFGRRSRALSTTRIFRPLNGRVSDVSDALSRIRLAGLYLRATEDRLVPSAAARLFEELAGGRVVDIEAPHLLLQASPQAAARAIREFIRELA